VIHGYPPLYNAGSEIYTQAISRGLARVGYEVTVFTREEDPLRPDYEVREEQDPSTPDVRLRVVNMPRSKERFRHRELDRIFSGLLVEMRPDVVHFGHLNHLSTGLVEEAHTAGVPSLFTLHDFWLMCPRGQFLQHDVTRSEPWALCDGQDDLKCAVHCYSSRNASGITSCEDTDLDYWRKWIGQRMADTRRIAYLVDVLIAPSRTVGERFRNDFGVPPNKLVYLDYGFDLRRFAPRHRVQEQDFVFGYIGTHRPAKGLHVLVDAAPYVNGRFRIRVWGRATADVTPALRDRVARLPPETGARFEWMGEYGTDTIVRDVFDRIDALVVPSIWLENSPLVIHEAQQARVPVLTADLGGMAEYVQEGVNGLLFTPRDARSLATRMQQLMDAPELARSLGSRGYLYSKDGAIPNLEAHVRELQRLYERARNAARQNA